MYRRSMARFVIIVGVITLLSALTMAQHPHANQLKSNTDTKPTGILLLAHGGRQGWNDEVNKLVAHLDKTMPTEVAFGMASKRSIQPAIDRLIARDVREIVAVPLFISSHSSVITSTQFLLGHRAEAPADLAMFAKMDHHTPQNDHPTAMHASFDPTTPVKSPVPIRMTAALDRHHLVADILLSRAQSISREPAREVVVVVAHGPVSDDNNNLWLADMGVLVERMRAASGFKRIERLTVRDDAKEPVRSQATAELRKVVERAVGEQNKVLIVPLLLSYGGIEEGVRKRLEGLNYEMSAQGLLPDERLARWVLLMVEESAKTKQ
ncbi:MAG TPA: CbiX/SirB N-terminal domain-containing protein [Pyrinomonadaceae bacterium]|nr:CbiX/SirB N-terminal domain-containing protein [Pyrinomonadaceae bacterium]